MRFSISRQHGLIGLYYCPAVKELALNLTRTFGLRVKFAQTQAERQEELRLLRDVIEEKNRLERLSNQDLVREVIALPIADYEEVIEMMDRLYPNWLGVDAENV